MEKSEKEANKTVAKEAKKSAGAGDVALHPRLRQMLDRINADVKATKAFREIKKRGCDEAEVLTILFRFCGGSEEEIRGGLDAAVAFKVEVERLGERLKQDAEAVRKIMGELPRFGLNLTLPENDELAFKFALTTLEDFGDMLSRIGEGYAKSLKNVRLGSKEKGKGRVNLTAGRTHHLVELADLVTEDREPILGRATDMKGKRQAKEEEPQKTSLADFNLIASLVRVVLKDKRADNVIADDLRNRFSSYINPKRGPKRRSELSSRTNSV